MYWLIDVHMTEHRSLFLQHAGEVYGEKAILATEVRELQCRLLSLSDERDKSLAILDEVLTPLHPVFLMFCSTIALGSTTTKSSQKMLYTL